jgi:hypothetical protein
MTTPDNLREVFIIPPPLKRIISIAICYYFQQNLTCSAGEVRSVLPSVAAVEPSSSEPPAEAVVSE